MTRLSGSVNRLTPDELQAERARYDENGWRFPDGMTHKVRVQIPLDEIDEFCAALKMLRQDRNGIYTRGPEGSAPTMTPAVSFYLSGSEMTGNWIKLWGRVAPQQGGYNSSTSPVQPAAPQQRTAVSRPTAQPQPAAQPTQPSQPVWSQSAPAANSFDQEDIPF